VRNPEPDRLFDGLPRCARLWLHREESVSLASRPCRCDLLSDNRSPASHTSTFRRVLRLRQRRLSRLRLVHPRPGPSFQDAMLPYSDRGKLSPVRGSRFLRRSSARVPKLEVCRLPLEHRDPRHLRPERRALRQRVLVPLLRLGRVRSRRPLKVRSSRRQVHDRHLRVNRLQDL
jgi:hypothetical protein